MRKFGLFEKIHLLRIMIYHWMVVMMMDLLSSVGDNGCLSLDEKQMMMELRMNLVQRIVDCELPFHPSTRQTKHHLISSIEFQLSMNLPELDQGIHRLCNLLQLVLHHRNHPNERVLCRVELYEEKKIIGEENAEKDDELFLCHHLLPLLLIMKHLRTLS